MSRNKQPGAERTAKVVRLWTYEQIRGATPYVKSVLSSIREHHVEAQAQHSRAGRLEAGPGRGGRDHLIALAEVRQGEVRSRDARDRAEEELNALDVFCLNPIRGEAIVPFAHDNQLAWYWFDLFDDNPVRFWRYQTDDLEIRRPVEATAGAVQV